MVHKLRNQPSVTASVSIVLTFTRSATYAMRAVATKRQCEAHGATGAALGGTSRVSVLVALITTGLGHIGAED